METSLWTWAEYIHYRHGDDLWTDDGCHVGRFDPCTVRGCDARAKEARQIRFRVRTICLKPARVSLAWAAVPERLALAGGVSTFCAYVGGFVLGRLYEP